MLVPGLLAANKRAGAAGCERGTSTWRTARPLLRNCAYLLHAVPTVQVFLTATHLVLVMEYAAGGDLAHYVAAKQGLTEGEARWFFQQLIVAVDYCHRMVGAGCCMAAAWLRLPKRGLQLLPVGRVLRARSRARLVDCPRCLQGVSSRDIKLQNILLDGSPQPLIKVWACKCTNVVADCHEDCHASCDVISDCRRLSRFAREGAGCRGLGMKAAAGACQPPVSLRSLHPGRPNCSWRTLGSARTPTSTARPTAGWAPPPTWRPKW